MTDSAQHILREILFELEYGDGVFRPSGLQLERMKEAAGLHSLLSSGTNGQLWDG
jgi:hypothetical protein